MSKRKIIIFLTIGLSTLLLAGCFQGEQSLEEMDPPKDAEAVSKEEGSNGDLEKNEQEKENDDDLTTSTVARQLYLLDANGMIVSQVFELPNPESKEVASQVLEYLVKDGPVTSMLPNGFQAVLPQGTEVLSLSLQDDGVLVVDLSKEFADYEAKEELNILQSITYTLTQFDSVDQIKLRINGEPQNEMPVNKTPIEEGYTRGNGINIIESDATDLINSKAVTMYYPAEHNENRYYIPITQHVEMNDSDLFSSIVNQLLKGPGYQATTTHVFNENTMLTNKPTLKKGVLQLEFSEEILKDVDKGIIADEVMETLVRTLAEQSEVEAIEVQVENVNTLTNENGEAYSEPVTANTFNSTEKL